MFQRKAFYFSNNMKLLRLEPIKKGKLSTIYKYLLMELNTLTNNFFYCE